MFGIVNKKGFGLVLLCLVAVLTTAIPAGASSNKHKPAKKAPAAKITSAVCQANFGPNPDQKWLNVETCSVKTNVKTQVVIGTSVDTSYALQTRDLVYRKAHTATIRALGIGTTYHWNVSIHARGGKWTKPARKGSFSTQPAGGKVAMTTRGSQILVNGIPMFVAADMLDPRLCWDAASVQQSVPLGINLFIGSIFGCPDQDQMLQAIEGKAWYVASLINYGVGNNSWVDGVPDGVTALPNFVGWTQGGNGVEMHYRPTDLSTPPDGKPVFATFDPAFWAGDQPGWYGVDEMGNDLPEPTWGPATTRAYFSKANVLGYYPSCPQDDGMARTYVVDRSLLKLSGKPVLQWIHPPGFIFCSNPSTTLTRQAQFMVSLEAGVNGFGIDPHGRTSSYGMSSLQAEELSALLGRVNALSACLLTGKNITPEISTAQIASRACRYGGQTYILATNTGDKPVKVGMRVGTKSGTAMVLWEGRSLKVKPTGFTDSFQPLQTHIYRINY